jgi:hypothetical protein
LKNLRIPAWSLAVTALLLLSTTRAIGSPPPKTDSPKADCAFSNPGYSGWCRQTVSMKKGTAPKEGVLSCLNSNACESNYCNAQNIRSGWRLEEAKASAPPH